MPSADQSPAPPEPPLQPYPDRPRAFFGGLWEAVGLPTAVMSSSAIGFGSFAREAGFPAELTVLSVFTVWGMPGQIAMVELFAAGAALLPIAVAAAGANARFLPMTVSLFPMLKGGFKPWAWAYLLAHFVSVNTWIALMRRGPSLPLDQRAPYFAGYSLFMIISGAVGATLGFALAGVLPRPLTLGLVYLSPVYFLMVFAGVRERGGIIAVLIGVGAGPLLHLISPDWGVPATGVIGGTLAFLLDRKVLRRE
ncbi:MAG: AzlC family ABC transporter permease [Rhodospirillales bacterium]|nr:AzlC family ABC transporter permease [Rhodospirillales bacterium]